LFFEKFLQRRDLLLIIFQRGFELLGFKRGINIAYVPARAEMVIRISFVYKASIPKAENSACLSFKTYTMKSSKEAL